MTGTTLAIKHSIFPRSVLNRGFDDALTEFVVNDGGILGRDCNVDEGGRRICILRA